MRGGLRPAAADETEATIAEIQVTGNSSELAGDVVTTRGVVTAAYPTGGYYAFVIQTEDTGAGDDATPGASDLLGYQSSGGVDAEIGQFVEVTGLVPSARTHAADLNTDARALEVLDEPFDPVTPLATDWWATASDREAHGASWSTSPGSTSPSATPRTPTVSGRSGSRPATARW